MTHQCSFCEYSTERLYNLKRHVGVMHSKENEEKKSASSDGKSKKYQCTKCNKGYDKPSLLKKHEEVCSGPKSSMTCPNCSMVFDTRQAKYKHKFKCENTQTITNNTNNITNNNQQTNSHNTNTTNNNVNSHNNYHVHIHMHNFGEENREHLQVDFIKQCFALGPHGVSPMIDKIFFDKEHPENHNVKLISLKHSLCEVFKDHEWVPHGLKDIIDRMITKCADTILDHVSGEIIANPTQEKLLQVSSIQNMEPRIKKTIQERTRGKLVARRKFAKKTETASSSKHLE
jgi:hypothetical protein